MDIRNNIKLIETQHMIISPCVSVAGVHVVALIIAALIVVLVAMVALLFVRIESISMKEQIKYLYRGCSRGAVR